MAVASSGLDMIRSGVPEDVNSFEMQITTKGNANVIMPERSVVQNKTAQRVSI